jgi:hypothetical protein
MTTALDPGCVWISSRGSALSSSGDGCDAGGLVQRRLGSVVRHDAQTTYGPGDNGQSVLYACMLIPCGIAFRQVTAKVGPDQVTTLTE